MDDYKDINGDPISLYRLVRQEPDWAASNIDRLRSDCARLEAEVARLTDRHEVDQERVRKAYDAVSRGVDEEDRLGAEIARLRECVRVRDDWMKIECATVDCDGCLAGKCPMHTHPLDPLPGKPDEEA